LKPCEKLVSLQSDCYLYSPSQIAKELFFYPIYVGNFIYEDGYHLYRDSYDSILLMYIRKGSMTLEVNQQVIPAAAGSFVLVDCYQPHSYGSPVGYECLWIHFDGPNAKFWYQNIVSRRGNVITLADPVPTLNKLEEIFQTFHSGRIVNEALISKYINDILTSFLISGREKNKPPVYTSIVGRSISYMNDHFSENITVEKLAAQANLSQYHFIRLFKKEIGLPPHKYLLNIRINAAKYLLKNSALSVKHICYRTGFSCESVFCHSFKKHLGVTPSQYRHSISDVNL